jgi:hypothetical protein
VGVGVGVVAGCGTLDRQICLDTFEQLCCLPLFACFTILAASMLYEQLSFVVARSFQACEWSHDHRIIN